MRGVPSGTPFIKWRVLDFETSLAVQLMPGLARMLYRALLDKQFIHGSVPDDPARCAHLLNVPVAWVEEFWPHVRPCFGTDPDVPGFMAEAHASAMIAERTEAADALRAVRAESGRRGGLAKAANAAASSKPSKSVALAKQTPSKRLANSTQILDIYKKIEREIDTEKETETKFTTFTSSDGFSQNGNGEASKVPASGDPPKEPSPKNTVLAEPPSPKPKARARKEGPCEQPSFLPSSERGAPLSRARPPSEQDLAAYAVMRAAWPVIEQQNPDYPQSEKTWSARNKAAALTLASKLTPEDVVAELRFAYDDATASQFYGQIVRLDKLIDALPRLRSMRETRGVARARTGLTHGGKVT